MTNDLPPGFIAFVLTLKKKKYMVQFTLVSQLRHRNIESALGFNFSTKCF